MSTLSRPCILYGELADRPTLPPGQEYIFIALDTGQIYMSNLTRTAWVAVGVTEAGEITYTPAEGADWSPIPDDVAEALDQAAQRVARLESVAPALPRQNLLPNPFFDRWSNGLSVAPAEWAVTGSGASGFSVAGNSSTVARYGRYAFGIQRTSADAIATLNVLTYYPASMFTGRRLRFGAWVVCGFPNQCRISVNIDGTPTYSPHHTGSGAFEFLEVPAHFITAPSTFTVRLHLDTNGTGYFSAVILTEHHLGGETVPYAAPPFNSLPDRATMWHDQATVLVGNALAYFPGNAQEATSRQNAPAIGDMFANSCLLSAGVYTFRVVGQRDSGSADVDWTINETTIVTGQRWYNSSSGYLHQNVTGVVVPYDGLHIIRGHAAGKAGSSSNYRLNLHRYMFITEDS